MQNLLEIQEFQESTSLLTLGALRSAVGNQQTWEAEGTPLSAKIRIDDIYKGISTTLRRTLLEHCLTPQSLNMLQEKMSIERDQLERELDVMWRGGWMGLPDRLGYYRVNRKFVATHAAKLHRNLEQKFQSALGDLEDNRRLSMQVRALINPEHRRILSNLIKDNRYYDNRPYEDRRFLNQSLQMFFEANITLAGGVVIYPPLGCLGNYLSRLERL